MTEKYYFTREIVQCNGFQEFYVYADSLEEAKAKAKGGESVMVFEEADVVEIGEPEDFHIDNDRVDEEL